MEYKFNDIEKKWQDEWKKRHTYRVENHSDRPKYYVLDMFPYPSGAGLHVGHPLGYIASDIVARYKRLAGFNVLHPMGFDSFGLPAEQYAIQTGQHPEKTTKENITRYIGQMNKIGFSFDWEREVRTSDPSYYKWTQWIFLQIFKSWYNNKTKKAESIDSLIAIFEQQGFSGSDDRILTGDIEHDVKPFSAEQWKNFSEKEKSDVLMHFRLAYLDEAWVNWCPALGTVLANDEVKDGVSERGGHPVERKRMPQWSMRITSYAERLLNDLDKLDWTESMKEAQRNWIGRSEGTSLRFKIQDSKLDIEVFTTRPDTIFGVTFVTLAPEHELVSQITTAEYKNEVDAYVTMAKNRSERERMADVKKITGQFTGAYVIHPFTNEKIPVWIGDYVLAGYGTGAVMAVPAHDSRDYAFAKHFNLPIKEVISGGDISKESYDAKEGKCINSDFLNGLEVKDALKKAIAEVEKRGLGKGKTNYRLRDAAFGRQRYWGEPIPVYYKDGIPYPVDEADLPIVLPQVDKFLPTESGEPPLARAKNWVYQPHPRPLSGGEGSLGKNNSGEEGSLGKNNSGEEGSLGENNSGEEGSLGKNNSGEEGSLGKNNSGEEGSLSKYRSLSGEEDAADDQNEDWILKEALYHYQTAKKEAWAKLKNMARDNRKSPTEAENILWQELRNKKTGFKIRRQHAIDVFIADFVCIRKRVVIEVDGNYHNDPEQRVYDEQRTAILNDMGFDVIRFQNDEVIHNTSDVVKRITKILSEKQLPVSAPSGHAEGGAGTGSYPLETTTMPGWAGSSWYFLRYMDPKNEKEFVSQEAVNYWKNVDLYIGGSEHATGHLLYVRFWTKFLFDRGFIPVEEPAQKLINQGMIQGESAFFYQLLIRAKKAGGQAGIQYPSIFISKKWRDQIIAAKEKIKLENWYDQKPIIPEIDIVLNKVREQIGIEKAPELDWDNVIDLRVNVEWVDGKNMLDIGTFKNAGGTNAQAEFVFEEGNYIVGREVEKMSKSKWNVVTPDLICDQYGADTLRLYEMFLGPLEQHKPWNTNGITGVFGFLKRFWRLFENISEEAATEAELKVVHRTLKKIKDDIERYSFNTCVSQFMICVNELTDMKTNKREALEPLVIALSPFAPHISEELWEMLGHKESVTKAEFPEVIEKYLVDDSFAYPVQINGKVRFNFTASLKLTPAEIEKEILSSEEAAKYLEGKSPKKVIVVPKRIVNIVI